MISIKLGDVMISAGQTKDVLIESGKWIFVDIGFSKKNYSCAMLVHPEERPEVMTFSDLKKNLNDRISRLDAGSTINLVLEAPLSVAFNKEGNPAGRKIEKRGKQHRYWYEGAGPPVMIAAAYLLKSIFDKYLNRNIYLFEGFVSFKINGPKSSHADDVIALRNVVLSNSGVIVSSKELQQDEHDQLESAFKVFGMDFGIPAVIMTGD